MNVVRSVRRLRLAWHGRFGTIPNPERWVFIVGCYNSGTTLLHRLVARHPNVGSLPGEGQFLTDVLPVPRDMGISRLWALRPDAFRLTEKSTGVDAERLKRQWGARFNHPHRPVLAEKSPTHAARTRWLQAHFENAHFIGIVRNGYAVSEGIRRREGHDIRTAARQWRVCNEIMLEDFSRLRRARIVSYEALTAHPANEWAILREFLGLDPDAGALETVGLRIRDRFSPIRNMNSDSFTALSQTDLQLIRDEAGALLDAFGYESPGQVALES